MVWPGNLTKKTKYKKLEDLSYNLWGFGNFINRLFYFSSTKLFLQRCVTNLIQTETYKYSTFSGKPLSAINSNGLCFSCLNKEGNDLNLDVDHGS